MTKRKRRPPWESEVDLAKAVVHWLGTEGWEVYQEVQAERKGSVCDIVAVRGPDTWAIETKLSFGLPGVEQAYGWLLHANRVSIATGPAQPGNVLPDFCAWKGIGRLEFRPSRTEGVPYHVQEVEPTRREECTGKLFLACTPAHKTTCLAGGNRGGYLTPFKETCVRVLEMVQRRPGISVWDLVSILGPCHYATRGSARAALTKSVEKGWVPGVKMDKMQRLHPIRLTDPALVDRSSAG